LVTHGHFTVNNKPVDIASYQLRAGDVVRVKESDRPTAPFRDLKSAGGRPVPEWVTVEYENYAATVNAIPTREQIDTLVDEQQVVEFYSR